MLSFVLIFLIFFFLTGSYYTYHVGSSSNQVNDFLERSKDYDSVHLLNRRDTQHSEPEKSDKNQSSKKPTNIYIKNNTDSENSSVKTTVKGDVDRSSSVTYATINNTTSSSTTTTNSSAPVNGTQVEDVDKNRTSSNSTKTSTAGSKVDDGLLPSTSTETTTVKEVATTEDSLPGYAQDLTNETLAEHNITKEEEVS